MQAKLSYIRLLYVITVIPAAAVFIQSRSRSLSEPLLYHTTNGPNLSLLTGGFPKPKLPHSMHSSNNNLIRPIDSSRIQTTLRLMQQVPSYDDDCDDGDAKRSNEWPQKKCTRLRAAMAQQQQQSQPQKQQIVRKKKMHPFHQRVKPQPVSQSVNYRGFHNPNDLGFHIFGGWLVRKRIVSVNKTPFLRASNPESGFKPGDW